MPIIVSLALLLIVSRGTDAADAPWLVTRCIWHTRTRFSCEDPSMAGKSLTVVI